MKRLAIALALAASTTAYAHGNFNISGDRCSADNFHWDGERAYVEKQIIEPGALRSLKASVTHAPISVTGGSTNGYVIEACKAAARAEDLSAIRVTLTGGELRAEGPDHSRWFVSYQIRVPNGGSIDVSAENGPVSIKDLNGTIVARAANGPLALSNVSGSVDATTTNGPISVKGGSGDMKVRATNGPLSVTLDGGSWRNGSLDASTQNGPLSLRLPRNYGSGVVVESNGRGPLSCKAEGCERFQPNRDSDDYRRGRWDDEPRRIELGRGPEVVRLSTVNGPITIKDE
jgi:hypothetical protein